MSASFRLRDGTARRESPPVPLGSDRAPGEQFGLAEFNGGKHVKDGLIHG